MSAGTSGCRASPPWSACRFRPSFISGVSPIRHFWVLSISYFLGAYYLGPTFSMVQGMVGLRMRALAASISLFILNIIGLGLGPQFTGVTSDVLNAFTELGADSLRWALVISLIFNLVSALLYLAAGRTLREDLEAGRQMA